MVERGGYDWIDMGDGTWEIYSRDRKIAHIAENANGWHIASDPGNTFPDYGMLLRNVEAGRRDGFEPQRR